ncbi:DsbC family protein [Salinisphaera sp. P385]|uniref:Thiol:disulfide interchange protein n=1 Tax=Spectribacter acetivorans TaxID=3075603 RepID=A0ABU3B9N7_9GAMM|nr:DsbC family protein [Salinisphaera sp. P385]MDT0619179.1 DsbC family protein [Salinisphaera sp. P385]
MQRFRSIPTMLAAGLVMCLMCQPVRAGDLSDPEFRQTVADRFPGVAATDISETPLPGMWQISQSGVVGYISADGRYLFDGDMIDLEKEVNLAEAERRNWRLEKIGAVAEQDMILYEPARTRDTITVFTDVACRHCRRLHEGMDRLLEAGIRVRYLFYPLSGPDSSAFRRAQSVWCAADRKQALTRAFRGERIEADASCDNPVADQYRLAAQTMNLRGTPTIVTGDGRVLSPGLPVAAIIREATGQQSANR